MRNRQAIVYLFLANSISGFSQGISMIAIPWYFSNTLEMPGTFGRIYLFVTFISLFWGLYAGSLIDKFNRQRIFLGISLTGMMVMASAAVLGSQMTLLPAWLAASVFAMTIFMYNLHFPNLYAFAQEITAPSDYSRITSWIEIQGQTTTALAGAMAAILLKGAPDGMLTLMGFQWNLRIQFPPIELWQIFTLNAFTYSIALFLVSRIKFQAIAKRRHDSGSLADRLRTGFRYLFQNPLLFLFGNLSLSIFVTIIVISFFLNPVYIRNHLHAGAEVFASYEMYFALGSVLAGVFMARIFGGMGTVKGVIILSLIGSLCLILNVLNTQTSVFYGIGFLLGLSNAGARILRTTYLFQIIPNDVIGRTGSVFVVINVLVRLVFIYICSFPWFMEGAEIKYTMLILSIFIALSALILALYYNSLKALVNKPKEIEDVA